MSGSSYRTKSVFLVRDASGEYIGSRPNIRTPSSDEAAQYRTREEAEAAFTRETDRVQEIDPVREWPQDYE